MAPNGAQNYKKNICFVGHFFMEFFGQVRKNSGKDHLHPQNLPAPTSMCCTTTDLGIFWNVLVLF